MPGLDEILGGGFPEYSFNIIAGAPGCGKTTLAHQFIFENATPERPAIYFTILGEPAVKMLRYQQQYTFFDSSKLNESIRFINLSRTVLEQDLAAVLETIVTEVENANAGIVVVDSFRTVLRRIEGSSREMELQGFVQRLALHLTSLQSTSFLVGEYMEAELRDNPVFTVADGLIWLYQSAKQNSVVRKMHVMKLRGQGTVPGLHTFRITENGLECFPRTFGLTKSEAHLKDREERLSTGVSGVDKMVGGGLLRGDSLLLAGPSGSGKTLLASHFLDAGLKADEPGVAAIFEELPEEYVRRAGKLGFDFDAPRKDGRLKIIYIRPLDLTVDETLHEIVAAVREIGAKRVVLDSLVGFEMALAPEFRHEFRESLYRMIGALTRLGVTVCSTVEIEEDFTSMGFSNFAISFLADDILRMRYVSINGQWRKMMLVVKMRGGPHSHDMWEYSISDKGVQIGKPLRGYRGLTSGLPSPWAFESGEQCPGPRNDHSPGAKREQGSDEEAT